uniref:Putative peptidase C1-like protein F26E4.3 n=1 Tax=Lygus hesperus TaxID=30085 RepID=A0A146LQ57_LYGHE
MTGFTVQLSFLCFTVWTVVHAAYDDLRSRKYCELRPSPQCCTSRDDDCSMPVDGTKCYCDQFCDRRDRGDCCFDYKPFCLNITTVPTPTRTCWFSNAYKQENSRWMQNCNECECKFMSNQMEVMCTNHECLVDDRLIEEINRNERSRGWRAGRVDSFMGRKLQEGYDKKTGTFFARKQVMNMLPKEIPVDVSSLPASFDSRDEWPSYVTPPQDQSWCANSWVWSTVGVASDRWGIMSKGHYTGLLSAQNLFSCNLNQKGCNGGYLTRAWNYILKFGLVTDECLPWTGDTPDRCAIRKKASAKFVECPGNQKSELLRRIGPPYRISGEHEIMEEIMTNGPVQATMRVQRDFFVYKGGVYRCSETSRRNVAAINRKQHSVRIVGWGETTEFGRREKYWIAANSWGREWGENGYFKILRGTDECGIETFVLAMTINSTPAVDPYRFAYNTTRFSR